MINVRQNKAFALTFSLIFLFLIVSFMAVYILAVANGISQANRTANLKKAYYIADAGLADAYERITQAGLNLLHPVHALILIFHPHVLFLIFHQQALIMEYTR